MDKSKALNIKSSKGFTITEIIVVVSIIGILMMVAVPGLTKILQANQATQQSHDFVSAIQLGISEADKNSTNITVCAKKEMSDECVDYTENPSDDIWKNGWLLFTDNSNNGLYESASETLIRTQINGSNSIKVEAAASAITIGPGSVVVRGDGDYHFSPPTCTSTSGHKVTVYKTGQFIVKGGVCP